MLQTRQMNPFDLHDPLQACQLLFVHCIKVCVLYQLYVHAVFYLTGLRGQVSVCLI